MSRSPRPNNRQLGPSSPFLDSSPGASHVSLPGILAAGAAVPLHSNTSIQRVESNADLASNLGSEPPFEERFGRPHLKIESSRITDRTNALWAEMQATLEEVEISASSGSHVFGSEHDRKLAELRATQIGLAQAWARSETDDAADAYLQDTAASTGVDEIRMRAALYAEAAATSTRSNETGSKGGFPPAGSVSAKQHAERLGQKIEGDTEVDIAMARKRREANDQYFERVSNSVLDVVAKLEDVAQAMRAVEQESKFVWDENRSASESTGM